MTSFRCLEPSCGEWISMSDGDAAGQAECPACGLRQSVPLTDRIQADAPAGPRLPARKPGGPLRPEAGSAPGVPDVVKRRGSLVWVALLTAVLLGLVALIVGLGVVGVRALATFDEAQNAYARGYYLEQGGRTDEAIAAYREATRQNPKFFLAHHRLGITLIDAGRPDEAAEALREAAALLPEDGNTRYSLGVALNDLGRHEEALEALNEALTLGADKAYTHHMIGDVYDGMGDLDRALLAYEEALRHDPQSAVTHWNIGVVLEKQGKRAEAESAYRKARQLDPGIDPGVEGGM